MYLMMDIEISCKGHCDISSHFLYLVSYTVYSLLSFVKTSLIAFNTCIAFVPECH